MRKKQKTKSRVLVFSLLFMFTSVFLVSANDTKRPLAYFSFDKAENTAVEDSIGHYSGILMDGSYAGFQQYIEVGKALAGPQIKSEGKISSAIEFDGVDDYATVYPDLDISNPKLFSAFFWIKSDKLPEIKNTIVQFLGDDAGKETIFSEAYLDSRGLVLSWESPEGNKKEIVSSVPAGDWVHVGAVFGDGEVSLYVNGEKKESKQSSLAEPTAKYMIIAANTKGDFFKGSIDELIVYDGIASEQQIKGAFDGVKPELPKEEETTTEDSGTGDTDTGTGAVPEMPAEPAEEKEKLLVLYMPLDKGLVTGSVIADAFNQNKGIIKEGELPVAEDAGKEKLVEGRIGQALELDGVGDYISMPYNDAISLQKQNGVTFSAWIKPENREGYEFQTILRKAPSVYGEPWPYSLNLDRENSHAQCSLATGQKDVDRFVSVKSNSEIPLNEWTLITCVLDVNALKIYINGKVGTEISLDKPVEIQSGLDPTGESPPKGLYIGSSGLFESHFSGAIDDVRIYNYGLTAEEAIKLFEGRLSAVGQEKPSTAETMPETASPEAPDYGEQGEISATGSAGCSPENPEMCYTEEDCLGSGLNWCTTELGGSACQSDSC